MGDCHAIGDTECGTCQNGAARCDPSNNDCAANHQACVNGCCSDCPTGQSLLFSGGTVVCGGCGNNQITTPTTMTLNLCSGPTLVHANSCQTLTGGGSCIGCSDSDPNACVGTGFDACMCPPPGLGGGCCCGSI